MAGPFRPVSSPLDRGFAKLRLSNFDLTGFRTRRGGSTRIQDKGNATWLVGRFFGFCSTQQIRLGTYSQGLFGGSRLTFQCPDCERRCFSLFGPTPTSLVRPDGSVNQRRLLCKLCHRLHKPAWRYAGGDSDHRALHQRRRLQDKLGDHSTERQPGCSVTRHNRRFARYLKAEYTLLTGNPIRSS